MVYLKHETVHNSTFNEDVINPLTKHMWHNSCESPSISSIEDSFNPTEIKEIVESLVMSKFGSQYNKKFLKSTSRRSQCQTGSSSGNNFESPERSCRAKISKKKSDYSINTSNISELISNVPSSTMFGVESVDDALRYLDTCISSTPLSMENMSLLEENSFESDDLKSVSATAMVEGSDVSLDLLNKKKLILYHTKEQILKAIHYHENHSKLTFHRERLEAEKLLLITDSRMESLFYEIEELTCVENINSFCSGSLLISNMHLFPEQFCDQHFVCLITFGSKVFATEISKMKSNGVIYFDKKFAISCLQPNFKLHLQIYSASPKVFKKSNTSHVLCTDRDYRHEDDVPFRKSIFSLWGEADIELCHLSQPGNLQIQMDSGLFTACISSQPEVNMNLSGFLNVSKTSSTCPSWDRQFCCINGGLLNFYNYPPKQLCDITTTGVVNLETCELIFPSRDKCSRKHTICLKNADDGVLMSFDTQYEFECWSKYLNVALSHIRTWHKC